jgi:predicted dehydrogenase
MSAAANENYRVGLVGCGHIASSHLKGWRQAPGGSVTGVFDTDRDLSEKLARRFGIREVYRSLEELLANCEVVDICTPPQSHAAILIRVLEAGRRPLIEKPVVISLAEWDTISERISAAELELAVAHHLKFTRSFQKCKRWLDQERIGRLLRIDWQFLTSRETDRMLTADQHWSHDLPGGRWFETLPHNLYGIHHLCGALELASVTARRTAEMLPGAPADEVVIVLERAGTIATLHFSANCRLNQRKVTLTGSTGVITIDILSDLAWLTRPMDSKLRRPLGRSLIESGKAVLSMMADRPMYFLDQLRRESPHIRFIAAADRNFRGVGPPPTPFEEIDYVTRYCHRIGREIERQIRECPASTS